MPCKHKNTNNKCSTFVFFLYLQHSLFDTAIQPLKNYVHVTEGFINLWSC